MKNLVAIVLVFFAQLAFAEELTVTAPAASTAEVSSEVAKQLTEAEIPVLLEPSKKALSPENPFLRLFWGLVVGGILAVGAWYLLRKVKSNDKNKESTPQIKILSQHFLGPKKSLMIVRVAGESVLIGVTDQNISLVKELSLLGEDIPTQVPQNFAKSLEESEEFSMSGIQDFVTTRVKKMRSIT